MGDHVVRVIGARAFVVERPDDVAFHGQTRDDAKRSVRIMGELPYDLFQVLPSHFPRLVFGKFYPRFWGEGEVRKLDCDYFVFGRVVSDGIQELRSDSFSSSRQFGMILWIAFDEVT